MLGFGDLSKIQAIGNRLGSGRPSLLNSFFMGTGAGLVAAPCTGPILAALLAYSAGHASHRFESFALLGAYSFGFALPYTILGSFAASVVKIRIKPALQLGVKLLFSGIMFALAFYYLRIPFYSIVATAKPYWPVLVKITTPISIIVTVGVLIVPSLSQNKTLQFVASLLIALTCFSASQALTTASSPADSQASNNWLHDEAEALNLAKATQKPLLIDMWAEWCEACKKMDVTTFIDQKVVNQLTENWVALKFDLTENNATNEAIQDKYGIQSLPTLVIIPAGGTINDKILISGYQSPIELKTILTKYQSK